MKEMVKFCVEKKKDKERYDNKINVTGSSGEILKQMHWSSDEWRKSI